MQKSSDQTPALSLGMNGMPCKTFLRVSFEFETFNSILHRSDFKVLYTVKACTW